MAELHRDHSSSVRRLLFPPSRIEQQRAQREGMDQASRALSYLISGVLVWGGLGWLGDHLLHTRFLTPVGIVLGSGLAIYLIIVRFGQEAMGRTGKPGSTGSPEPPAVGAEPPTATTSASNPSESTR